MFLYVEMTTIIPVIYFRCRELNPIRLHKCLASVLPLSHTVCKARALHVILSGTLFLDGKLKDLYIMMEGSLPPTPTPILPEAPAT